MGAPPVTRRRTSVTLKAHEFDRVVTKFGFEIRDRGDRLAFFVYEGRRIITTKRSHMRGGDLPFAHRIRQQLKLNETEMAEAIDCTIDRDDYVTILRQKGLL
jgi:hypothetical protein